MSPTESLPDGLPAPAESAGLLVRLASTTYEAMLLFGVAFVAGCAVLATGRWTYPLAPMPRLVLQSILFAAIGAYFVYQWSKTGQTLAMKSWNLRVVDASGRPPRARRAIMRFLLAWHLFLPGVVWTAVFGGNVAFDLAAYAVGYLALLLPALADRDRGLLHDRLTSTRVVRGE